MSTIATNRTAFGTGTTAAASSIGIATAGTNDRVARASIAFGRKRGYYRLLFEAGPVDAATFATLAGVAEHLVRTWLEEQLAAGLLRLVPALPGDTAEFLLPGEFVPILLDDHGELDLAGARALLAEHRSELPSVLVAEPSSP